VFEEPPYEVSATGWGEFDIGIKIFFVDPSEKPVVTSHPLKLFSSVPGTPLSTTEPVVYEYYDELVFNDPTEMLYRSLQEGPAQTVSSALTPFCTWRRLLLLPISNGFE